MKTPTCFFCYAWGNEERYNKLDFLRKYIEERSNNRIKVILDRHTYKDNEDFNILRDRIRSYDLIVVFFTPDFKKIILDPDANKNKDREVLKEYGIIEERNAEDGNSVFPVIFEGDKKASLLDLFKNRNVRTFESFNLSLNEKKRFFVPKGRLKLFNAFVGKIINTTLHNNEDKSEEYQTSQEALDKLFGLTDNAAIPYSCLVTQDLYNQIRRQSCFFVAGRKGSGKSTFIHNFREMDRKHFDEHYKKMIPISAEAFQHENAYGILVARRQNDRDVIEPHTLLCLFWQIYFALHCMVIIRAEIEDQVITEDDHRFAIFNRISKKFMKKIGLRTGPKSYDSVTGSDVPRLVFMAAAEMIDRRFDTALDDISEDELLMTSFSGKFTLSGILEKEFSRKDLNEFLSALAQCEKKILIALDGFDTHSEDFRIETSRISGSDEHRLRVEYEELFFRSLLEVVTRFKNRNTNDRVGDSFGELVDFCIVLPKDRYDLIGETDRDIIKKNFGTLSWSAQELLELLTKRMEYLITTIEPTAKIDVEADYTVRMNNAFEFFDGLPTAISMDVDGNTITMPLFNYILRSSFWRPRDVISNLSKIMGQMMRLSDGKWHSDHEGLTEEDIKLSIKTNADRIIEKEFIGEYKYVFRNIKDVLNSFQGMDEQVSVKVFRDKIRGIRFDTAFSYDMNSTENKMQVLYQLGVIGLIWNKKIAEHQHYLHHVCFEFNEGMTPFEDFLKYKIQNDNDVLVVFNPLFGRRLMLNYNTKELIGNWDTAYIRKNHINKETIHGI